MAAHLCRCGCMQTCCGLHPHPPTQMLSFPLEYLTSKVYLSKLVWLRLAFKRSSQVSLKPGPDSNKYSSIWNLVAAPSSGRKLSSKAAANAAWGGCLPNSCSKEPGKKLPTRLVSGFVEKITHVGGSRRRLAGRRADRKALSANYQSDWTLAGNESIRSVESNSILEVQREILMIFANN